MSPNRVLDDETIADPRSCGVVWFRRDLRLGDNPAWAAATRAHDSVVALFVLEPTLLTAAGNRRRDVLFSNLGALDEQLRSLGAGLTVRAGPAERAVARLVAETGAGGVYLNRDHSSFARARDNAVTRSVGSPVYAFDGCTVHAPGSVLTKRDTLSKVFTPFHRRWIETAMEPWPAPGAARPFRTAGEEIPSPESPVGMEAGEQGAWNRLEKWLANVDAYPDTRDDPSTDGTSMLSADLKFGTLSPRAIVETVGTATVGRSAFVRQIAWRDWWTHTLAERPDLPESPLGRGYERIAWRDDPAEIAAWEQGMTGYPIVDAGIRQLLETGWMNGRVRMVAASFLVKDLLVDWRHGERFFRHHLIDGDVAQNAGNWQWVAGTGPDAAPYFRVLNPTTQARRFDPSGDYTRKWVPELAGLSAADIHEPQAAGPSALDSAGVRLGTSYPLPVVDHRAARHGALDAYKVALA